MAIIHNQLNHPELVPFDLNLVLLRQLGLLAITVSACSDSICIFVQRRAVKKILVRVVACQSGKEEGISVLVPSCFLRILKTPLISDYLTCDSTWASSSDLVT